MTKKKTSKDFLKPAPADYKWPRCPEADQFVEERLQQFLQRHHFARRLSDRMKNETSTRFAVWVDHLLMPARSVDIDRLEAIGFVEDKKVKRPNGVKVFQHPFADLPRIFVSARIKELGCAVMVEDIWRFQAAHGFSNPIEGNPYCSYRLVRLPEGNCELLIVERRGSLQFVPGHRNRADGYLQAFEKWTTRRRRFSSDTEGMKHTLRLARDIVSQVGTGTAAHVFLEGERLYWQSRNRAGQTQKARQDKLGLGWANHDHHTFRSSRSQFPILIDILLTFGFKKRERYYAGAEAGWGAQIMEQPEAGVIIFADVDLAPEDIDVDFSKVPLSDLKKPRTVGLWCALHGESMLDAGMHHLEAKFDFEQLKMDLLQHQIEIMPPFTDFPFLRQAFTKAEMWTVDETRLSLLLKSGAISNEAYQQMKTKGAVGSHLENLQRRDGFKGFNQRGVSHIISAVNPEKLALERPDREAA